MHQLSRILGLFSYLDPNQRSTLLRLAEGKKDNDDVKEQ